MAVTSISHTGGRFFFHWKMLRMRSSVSFADPDRRVEKGERGGRTYTSVTELDRDGRRLELARLTGGADPTPAMLAGAEELLSAADAYRAQL